MGRFFYRGHKGKILAENLLDWILCLATLGIYTAWARKRWYQRLTQQIAYNKKIRFTYLGTPQGFIRQVYPYGIATGLVLAGLIGSVTLKNVMAFFLLLLSFYGVFHYTRFMARHYSLNHLYLGDAAIRLDLPAPRYMMLVMKRALLNLVSFGYTIPQSDLEKWGMLVSHSEIGGRRLSFSGSAKPLRWVHLTSFGLPVLMLIVLAAMRTVMADAGTVPTPRLEAGRELVNLLTWGTILAGWLGRSWYKAALRAECLRGLSGAGFKVRSSANGHDLFKQRAVNTILFIFTLGLAYPVIRHRRLEQLTRTVIFQGDVERITSAEKKM